MNINRCLPFRLSFIYFLSLLIFSTNSGLFAQIPDSALFRDDFNRTTFGSSWEADGSWSIVNGSAYNFIGGIGGTLKTTKGYSQASYIIETTAKGFTANHFREFRITFGQADLLNHNQLYQLRYTAWFGGRLTLSMSTDNVYDPHVLDEVAISPGLSSSKWYKFKIARYKSGLIQVYADEGSGYSTLPILEAIDLTYTTLGHTGWQVDTESFPEDFFVDWISARKPGIEKPAIKEKPIEDSVITQVSAKSGKTYKVAKLAPGVKQFTDRDYTITSVPEYLKGASFIQTANADKLNTLDSFLTFFVKTPGTAIVYIGYDPRTLVAPPWLSQWTKTGDRIGTSDKKVGFLNVYSKMLNGFGDVYPFPNVLGANLAGHALGANINYLVAVIQPPNIIKLQAEDALLSGAVVANDHLNYNGTGFVDFINLKNDYIEWTVQIDVPGTYNLGFQFANGGSGDRALQITVNGKNEGTANFSPVTASWSTWSFHSGPNVFLPAGVNKIRVTATGTSGPNIDELSLYFSSPSPLKPIASATTALAKNSPGNVVAGKLADQSYQAFPNPFLQSTQIYYQLKAKAKVILGIYTIEGKKIQLLENVMRDAGNYQVTFNADKFAKGIYFYRLQIGNDVKIGKLIKE